MWKCSFLSGAPGWATWCWCSPSQGGPGQWVLGTGEDQPLPQWEVGSNPKAIAGLGPPTPNCPPEFLFLQQHS